MILVDWRRLSETDARILPLGVVMAIVDDRWRQNGGGHVTCRKYRVGSASDDQGVQAPALQRQPHWQQTVSKTHFTVGFSTLVVVFFNFFLHTIIPQRGT